ncbi:DoxX family protein [Agriterribacter sp.]|uniref:DoxX family protein n=1 Tax=Agriterribacter sp. TaxID=2821509 RepID=UPI002BDE16D1|nr:DoxX family protein [Agriterribacter sp.]HRP55012.1 DoxX family protein [Agriterribacter sp.]
MIKLFSTHRSAKSVDVALLIMRIGIALLMFTHGIPKIGKLSEDPVQFMDFLGLGATASLWLAIFGEIICSVLVMLGAGTRLAVIPPLVIMLVAVFHVHIADPFVKQEMGLHYILTYVVLFIMGSGRYSIDHLLFAGKRRNQ